MADLDQFLKRAGWKRRGGAWVSRSGRGFRVTEEAAPGAWDRSVAAFLAKAILQARAGVAEGVEPVAALKVRRATPLTDGRLAQFVEAVAPLQAWILFDGDGRAFPHVPSAPELADAAARQVVPTVTVAPPVRQVSVFTDLNQWMLKVLLAPRLPERLLRAPRGRPLRNASSLAQAANVSLPVAARFLNALEAEGQLDTRFGDLRVARPLELLPRWRDKMGHPARRELAAAAVRGGFDLKRLASQSRPGVAEQLAPVLGVHGACAALGLGHVTGALPVVWVPKLDPARLAEVGLVAVEGQQRADVLLRLPRYPQALFRGAVQAGATSVTDVIQCWLDTSHFQLRGEEQADFLWRKVLAPAFAS